MNRETLKNLLLASIFGGFTGYAVAYALGIFVPNFYTEWAGGLVCPGRVEYFGLKRIYYCYTAPNEYFELGDRMFRAVFIRAIFVTVPVATILIYGFIKLSEALYRRRAAAGF